MNPLALHNLKGLTRKRLIIDDRSQGFIQINGVRYKNFSSNDYLNLATHPLVKKAFIRGVQEYGAGSGSSQLISGYFKPHKALEDAFAEFLNVECALLFNSGYHANLGIFSAISNHNSVYIADKYVHASLIDGMRLSEGKILRFKHHDLAHAESFLQKHIGKNLFLVSESVFSMEGNISNIQKLTQLSQKYQAFFILDHAHGLGVIDIPDAKNISCLTIPLGKALGSMGAIVLGEQNFIESLIQFARTYCYTTALPPAVSVASLAALKILQTEPERAQNLKNLIRFFIKSAKELAIPLSSYDETPIKCILVNDNQKALDIQQKLLNHGFLVSCIRPPSVPKNLARIKISLNCAHTFGDITQLLDVLQTC